MQGDQHHNSHQKKGLYQGLERIECEGGPGCGPEGAVVAPVKGGVQGWVMEKAMGGVEHPILQDQHREITDSQIPPGVGISSAVQPGNPMGLQPQHSCGRQGKHRRREH